MTHINDGRVDSMPTGPFGGEKNSGIGHFGGGGIIEDFTTAHWVTTQRTPNNIRFEWLDQEDDIMKVGFIGLGSMGAGMSRNLIKAGHDLVVYNRTRSRTQELQSLGAKVADTASEAAVGVEALITMLADDRAVQDVIFEPGRAIESLPEGAIHISMSTISVDLSRRLAKSHADKHQNYIAAPVFG